MTSLVGIGLVVPVPVLVVLNLVLVVLEGQVAALRWAGGKAGTTGGGCTGGSCNLCGPPSAMVAYICSLT